MEVFQDYAYYYNSFYKEKDHFTEAKTVDSLLKKHNPQVKNIINFGCGTGKHDIELVKLGYCCKGIDMSPLMIDIAKENTVVSKSCIEFEAADIRYYETASKYDAVISLFHVISYQNSNQDVLNTFRSARKLLRSGGYFLFDVWYGPGVLSDPPAVRVKKVEDDENILIRYANPVMHAEDNIVDVCYNVIVVDKQTSVSKEIDEIHHMRYFFKPEVELILEQSGFSLIACLDCNTLKETDFNSWTSYFVAIRK